MMNFINWFKQSLEDDKGVASFRRIYNWILICMVVFVVIYNTVYRNWVTLTMYVLIILLAAGFLNTSVITVDNILRFFGRDKPNNNSNDQSITPQKVELTGIIKPKEEGHD